MFTSVLTGIRMHIKRTAESRHPVTKPKPNEMTSVVEEAENVTLTRVATASSTRSHLLSTHLQDGPDEFVRKDLIGFSIA